MKKKYIVIIIVALLALLIALFNNVIGFEWGMPKVNAEISNVPTITLSSADEILPDTSCFKKPQIVVLETVDESLLSEISRISSDGDQLFVLDRGLMEVLSFDMTGKYTGKISSKGQGPGEYIQISDFAVDTHQKQIILLCDIPNKIIRFAYDGRFIEEKGLDEYYSQLAVNEHHIYLEKVHNSDLETGQLHVINKETGKMIQTLDPIDIKNDLFISGNSLNRGKNILYVRRFDNAIYRIRNGYALKIYDLDFKKFTFPERLKQEERSEVILRECAENDYIYSMSNIVENGDHLMFTTNTGIFICNSRSKELKGYQYMVNPGWGVEFRSYVTLGNTDKIICTIDDPSHIKNAVERIPEERKTDQRFTEIVEVVAKLNEENNPILFIYDFID